jgi:hypothetical protein
MRALKYYKICHSEESPQRKTPEDEVMRELQRVAREDLS